MNDIDLRSRWPVVQFQTKPDCRAFAATEAYNLFRALNGLPTINVSESYIDTRGRLDIGPNLPLLVDGCLAAMQKWGCPTEDDWSNSNWGITPPASVDAAAAKHKIKSWGKISLDDDPTNPLGIIPAIYDRLLRGHPVAIGCGVTQEFENGGVGGYIKLPAPGTLLIGAHAVAIYGVLWNLRRVIFKNSRGGLWGDHGFGYLDFDWFLASGYRISSARFISEIIDAEPVPTFPPPTVNAMTIASIKALSNALVDPVTQAQKDQGLALFNALVVASPPVVVQPPVQPAGNTPDGTTVPPAARIKVASGEWTLQPQPDGDPSAMQGTVDRGRVLTMYQVNGEVEVVNRQGRRYRNQSDNTWLQIV